MSTSAVPAAARQVVYPESDGQPMSDNTRQFRWIVTLAGNLAALFRDRADVFVGGNLLWYPVEGEPEVRAAPDVYVVFGRPKGDRGSYRQWEEEGVPMTVVFEVLSPNNLGTEMVDKQAFYDEYGVEEYYLYDPESNRLHGYGRRGDVLARIRRMDGFVSPRLGIHFDLSSGPELIVRYPDGRPFLTFEQLEAARQEAEQRVAQAEQRAARMAELSLKVIRQEATPEELRELQRLAQGAPPPG
jgi:Uma2 family endonuclease